MVPTFYGMVHRFIQTFAFPMPASPISLSTLPGDCMVWTPLSAPCPHSLDLSNHGQELQSSERCLRSHLPLAEQALQRQLMTLAQHAGSEGELIYYCAQQPRSAACLLLLSARFARQRGD